MKTLNILILLLPEWTAFTSPTLNIKPQIFG